MKKFSNALFYLSNKTMLTVGFLVSCVGFTIWYMSFSDPLKSYGALSYIGLDHPFLFAIWGFLTETALLLNIGRMFSKFNYHNKYAFSLLLLGVLSIIITICVPFNYDNKIQFVVHCYGAISFIVFNGVSLIFFFVEKRKTKKLFLITAYVIGAIMLTTLALFATIGESGALEVSPLMVSFLIISIANFTKIYNPPLKYETSPFAKTKDENELVHKS